LYSVKVTDALGCIQNIADIEVKEPPLLEVLTLTTTPTTCFGKKDGQVRLEVIGGVAPYSLEFGGTQVFSGVFELDMLEKENYTWEVTDSKGCKIPVAFEITSPPPLVVDVLLEKPACPGEANGALSHQDLKAPFNTFGHLRINVRNLPLNLPKEPTRYK
jgi:hypothetical protein